MHSYAKSCAEYVVFDMARCNSMDYWPWGVMENMKNGWINTTKYDGKMIKLRPVKMLVLTNEHPPENKFTFDRYDVFDLDEAIKD